MDEVAKKPYLDCKQYLKENNENEEEDIKITNQNPKKDNHSKEYDDEGYYYERQLFTFPNKKKLTKFNFFLPLVLFDKDVYNLTPIETFFRYSINPGIIVNDIENLIKYDKLLLKKSKKENDKLKKKYQD